MPFCLLGLVDNVYKKYFEIVKVNSPSAISAGTEKKIIGSERNLEKQGSNLTDREKMKKS